MHHESTAFLNRFATVLYYLDGPGESNGGQTAFPLGPDGRLKEGAGGVYGGNVAAACSTNSSGVLIDPIPGDAVLFFNLDERGDVDPSAIHAACEVTGGEKWAANHWFNVPERRVTGVGGSSSLRETRADGTGSTTKTKRRGEEALKEELKKRR